VNSSRVTVFHPSVLVPLIRFFRLNNSSTLKDPTAPNSELPGDEQAILQEVWCTLHGQTLSENVPQQVDRI